MAKQWKQLTLEEVKHHPLNAKGGLSSFIICLCVLSVLGIGLAAQQVTEIYKIVVDSNQLPPQGSVLFIAIIPSLIYTIIFGFLIKQKTKHTLKLVIGALWTIPIVSFFHALIFWDYVGASYVPPEVNLSIIGRSIWVVIFTIGLVIYSFLSKKYNLQYLHRIKVDSNNNFNLSPQNNLDDLENFKNMQDIYNTKNLSVNLDSKPQVLNHFDDTPILQNKPPHQQISNQELITTEKTTSAKLNLVLLGVCSVAILIASIFAFSEYKDNLQCIEDEIKAQEAWKIKYKQFLYNLEQDKKLKHNEYETKRMQALKCANSDFEYMRKKLMGEEYPLLPEHCQIGIDKVRQYLESQSSSRKDSYITNNPVPHNYCD